MKCEGHQVRPKAVIKGPLKIGKWSIFVKKNSFFGQKNLLIVLRHLWHTGGKVVSVPFLCLVSTLTRVSVTKCRFFLSICISEHHNHRNYSIFCPRIFLIMFLGKALIDIILVSFICWADLTFSEQRRTMFILSNKIVKVKASLTSSTLFTRFASEMLNKIQILQCYWYKLKVLINIT